MSTQEVTTTFSLHSHVKSTISYCALYTSFLVYVMRCARQRDLDPKLKLAPEQIDHATVLEEKLNELCRDPTLLDRLKKIRRYPLDHFWNGGSDAAYPTLITTTTKSLYEPIHSFSFSLISLPLHLPPNAVELELPVPRFFAWKSWDPFSRAFRTPNNLHGLFIQMMFCMRVDTYRKWELSSAEVESGHKELLEKIHDTYLIQDATTPFGTLSNYIRYSGIISTSIAHAPTTTWVQDREAISIYGGTVSRQMFSEMIQQCIQDAKTILDDNVLFGRREEICGVKTGYLHRDAGLTDVGKTSTDGYSYIHSNRCFSSLEHRLKNFILDDEGLFRRFHQPYQLKGDESAWNHLAITTWLNAVDTFLLHLAACVYWASGQPCRLPELVSLLVENIPGKERNLYVIQDSLMIIQTYSKSLSVTQRPGMVIRMPAHKLQELIEAHLSIVHPLYLRFHHLLGTKDTSSSHLFTKEGRPMTSEILSQFIRRFSLQHVRLPWGVRYWRQYMISLSQMLLPSDILSLPSVTTAVTAQAAHSQQTVNLNYDQRTEFGVLFISTQLFQQGRMVSLAYLEMVGLPHPTLHSKADLQLLAGPSFRDQFVMGNMIQDAAIRAANTVLERHQINYREMARQEAKAVAIQEQMERFPVAYTIPVRNIVSGDTFLTFRRLYPGAHFRSQQQSQCVQHVISNQTLPLLAILPMGHGKSLIYHLAVYKERDKRTTLLIVPLLSLAQAANHSAEKLKINSRFINPDDIKQEETFETLKVDLVISTYDLLTESYTFRRWVASKATSGLLARIVVDEAHTILCENRFRTNFVKLPSILNTLPTRKVFLTGTLPEKLESEFVQCFGPIGPITSVRLPTDIPNLSYHVSSMEGIEENQAEIIKEFFHQLEQETALDKKARGIIYVPSTSMAENLATTLNSCLYMSKIKYKEKAKHLGMWLDEENQDATKKVMVATSSFALGVDYSYCRCIIFIGDPYGGVISFAQMAARAGRDGERAVITLYPRRRPDRDHLPGQEPAEWEKESQTDFEEFKTTTSCRRTPLSKNLDGGMTTCFGLPNAELCDNCQSGLNSKCICIPDSISHR